MNKTILIDSRISIREAVAAIFTKNNYDVVETTYVENLFDLSRITYNNRIDLTNIIIAAPLINSNVKETIKRVMNSDIYKNVPIYILTINGKTGDEDSEVGWKTVAQGITDDSREFYITKYKEDDDI